MNTETIIIGGTTILGTLILTGRMALHRDARSRRLTDRLSERVAPLARARNPGPRFADHHHVVIIRERLAEHSAMAFGYRTDRSAAYPASIPALLGITLALAVGLAYVASALSGLPLYLVLPLFWIGCAQAVFRSLHGRYATKLYRQFPDVLSMIVRSVRVGIPLQDALHIVAQESLEPSAGQFARVVDQTAIGISLTEALRDLAARTGIAEYAFFTVALSLQGQTGGSLAETLENLADVIRKRVALRLRAIALASEARMSAYILGALPVVTATALAILNPDYIRPLFTTKGGNYILLMAFGMLGTAAAVMRVLIQRSLR